jgi:hypothetical protein
MRGSSTASAGNSYGVHARSTQTNKLYILSACPGRCHWMSAAECKACCPLLCLCHLLVSLLASACCSARNLYSSERPAARCSHLLLNPNLHDHRRVHSTMSVSKGVCALAAARSHLCQKVCSAQRTDTAGLWPCCSPVDTVHGHRLAIRNCHKLVAPQLYRCGWPSPWRLVCKRSAASSASAKATSCQLMRCWCNTSSLIA